MQKVKFFFFFFFMLENCSAGHATWTWCTKDCSRHMPWEVKRRATWVTSFSLRSGSPEGQRLLGQGEHREPSAARRSRQR